MSLKRLVFIAPLALLSVPAVAADRPPTAAENARITQALNAAGYERWDSVELEQDDGRTYWEVDDARRSDGTVWDVKLAPQTYEVIRAKRDE
ncbi:PepSY domain-containing protein [Porphyrobacter sp. GA68]|uniref:PepSY domain-containing protein n=1 Tax=Porphyrobacter sp. GA68 TaxID=2883480 RepID=UPI001D180665|nr:PepSY domain-containing protein [Porphyrobacter sp. GA68]